MLADRELLLSQHHPSSLLKQFLKSPPKANKLSIISSKDKSLLKNTEHYVPMSALDLGSFLIGLANQASSFPSLHQYFVII
jgi:hypothetical protein